VNVSWFSLVRLHFGEDTDAYFGSLLTELTSGLSVLRCSLNLSGLRRMVILVFPVKRALLVQFLLRYIYFSGASHSLSEVSLGFSIHAFLLYLC